MSKITMAMATWPRKWLIVYLLLACLAFAIGLFYLIAGLVLDQTTALSITAGCLGIVLGLAGAGQAISGLRTGHEK